MPAPAVEFSLIASAPAGSPEGGLATIIDRLHILSDQMQKKGARAAARKAMEPVRDDARARAKVIDDEMTNDPSKPWYSEIWKNIVINESQRGGRKVGGVVMRVGIRGGALSKVVRTLTTDVPRPGVSSLGEGRRAGGQRVKVYKPVKTFVIHPGGDTRHWRFVELGTQRQRARAFMLPALETKIGKVIDTLATELEAQIDTLAHYHVTAHP